MKSNRSGREAQFAKSNVAKRIPLRRGAATMEIALSTMVVVFVGMGLYYMGQDGFVRLHHYISTMTGMPYQ